MSEKDFKARLKGFQEELDRVISIKKQGLSSVGLKTPEFNKGQQQDISNDRETAQKLLQEAGGDKEEARRLARERGYKF